MAVRQIASIMSSQPAGCPQISFYTPHSTAQDRCHSSFPKTRVCLLFLQSLVARILTGFSLLVAVTAKDKVLGFSCEIKPIRYICIDRFMGGDESHDCGGQEVPQ